MRTKVASFFIFFQELSNKKKIKALRPKMTKIASRGGSCLKKGYFPTFPNIKPTSGSNFELLRQRFLRKGMRSKLKQTEQLFLDHTFS